MDGEDVRWRESRTRDFRWKAKPVVSGSRLVLVYGVAARAGFEPATNRLTADRSTTELPGNTTRRNL